MPENQCFKITTPQGEAMMCGSPIIVEGLLDTIKGWFKPSAAKAPESTPAPSAQIEATPTNALIESFMVESASEVFANAWKSTKATAAKAHTSMKQHVYDPVKGWTTKTVSKVKSKVKKSSPSASI